MKRREITICVEPNCGRPIHARQWCGAHYARWIKYGSATAGGPTVAERKRFIERAITSISYECLIWPFYRDQNGYAWVRFDGRRVGVHRLICERAHGRPASPNLEAAHNCGNGHLGCINPHHLRWATHKENHQDRVLHGTNNAGEKCGSARLTETNVKAIRALNGMGLSKAEISRRYLVSESTIRHVLSGSTWRHV